MRAASLFLCLLSNAASAATFVVDTTSDTTLTACTVAGADCSLRGALDRANANTDADVIEFNIPTGDGGYQAATDHWRIGVGDVALPATAASVLIDGYSQPGANANTQTPTLGGLNGTLKIEIRGVSQFRTQQNGLEIGGNQFSQAASTFRGLVINSFGSQILLNGSSAHRVEGCYLGTDISGVAAAVTGSSRGNGVRIQGPGAYVIGGLLPAQRNLLSGLNTAISAFSGSDGLRVEGNLIGLNAAGDQGLPNVVDGFSTAAPLTNARIGGADPAARNVISAASFSALRLSSGGSNPYAGTRIEGNYFGTDVRGLRAIGNGLNPQSPSQPQATLLFGGGSFDCSISVGGSAPGQANLIAHGGAAGLQADVCSGVSSPLNHFRANRGIPIDNTFGGGAIGATPNDAGDADTGGNRLQNFAVITLPGGFLPAGGNSVEVGFLVDTATANATYPLRVDFYRADCGGGSRQLVGTTTIAAIDAQLPRTLTLQPADGGNVLPLTALAVDAAGNSSEFTPVQGEAVFADGSEDQPTALPAGRCD